MDDRRFFSGAGGSGSGGAIRRAGVGSLDGLGVISREEASFLYEDIGDEMTQ